MGNETISQSDCPEDQKIGSHFVTTAWSVVREAGLTDSPQASQALEKLCRVYWYPIYAEMRRRHFSHHDAQDLTQNFFACLLRRHSFAGADRSRGRFRSYLLGALKFFLADEFDRQHAEKRGGGRPIVSLDDLEAERRFQEEPASALSPDESFDRRWALALMERTFVRLETEFAANDKLPMFAALKPFLAAETSDGGYAAPAEKLQMTPASVAVAVHRMRQRFRELIRAEAAETLANLAEVDDELRHLFGG